MGKITQLRRKEFHNEWNCYRGTWQAMDEDNDPWVVEILQSYPGAEPDVGVGFGAEQRSWTRTKTQLPLIDDFDPPIYVEMLAAATDRRDTLALDEDRLNPYTRRPRGESALPF